MVMNYANKHLAWTYALLPEVETEGVVPLGWCHAVKMNVDVFDMCIIDNILAFRPATRSN